MVGGEAFDQAGDPVARTGKPWQCVEFRGDMAVLCFSLVFRRGPGSIQACKGS